MSADGEDIGGECGSMKRYEVQAMLNYIASEVHSTCGHLFNPTCTGDVREYITGMYKKKLQRINDVLVNGKQFLVGDSFTCADSYMYIVLTWSPYIGIDLAEYPNAHAYMEHIALLPKVSAALARMNNPEGGPTNTV